MCIGEQHDHFASMLLRRMERYAAEIEDKGRGRVDDPRFLECGGDGDVGLEATVPTAATWARPRRATNTGLGSLNKSPRCRTPRGPQGSGPVSAPLSNARGAERGVEAEEEACAQLESVGVFASSSSDPAKVVAKYIGAPHRSEASTRCARAAGAASAVAASPHLATGPRGIPFDSTRRSSLQFSEGDSCVKALASIARQRGTDDNSRRHLPLPRSVGGSARSAVSE